MAPESLPTSRADDNLLTPTDEEKANGWTAESLTRYIHERSEVNAIRAGVVIAPNGRSLTERAARQQHQLIRGDRQTRCNNHYDPFRW